MINISVVTGTRADYGLLYFILKEISSDNFFNLKLLVTGSHLSKEHGFTYKEILRDGFSITKKIHILSKDDQPKDIANNISKSIKEFSKFFEKDNSDLVILLGDRYESLGVAISCIFARKPILHIHGGEITEGAYDDMIRHSITKMSNYHSTTSEEHRNRVIQMGEKPTNVKNFGAPGLEFLKKIPLLNKKELSEKLKFDLNNFFLVTYHPETLSNISSKQQIRMVLNALDRYKEYNLLFTFPNADDGGKKIIESINNYKKSNLKRVFVSPSLGQVNYLSALSCCDLVIGNSSSAIIEAPSLKTITINIGERQSNRSAALSVINSKFEEKNIIMAIKKGLKLKKQNKNNIFKNPYGKGETSKNLVNWIKKLNISKKKSFHNLKK
tara:strand:+ start:13866 stop:15017 length:1152 start_codon:yes stop_codon:yes gene_type:complete